MKPLLSIQYLRAVAAGLVLLFHAGLFLPQFRFASGSGGVDIFFVISGFVMYLAGRNLAPGEFALHRIVRIVPLYWTMTLVTVFVMGPERFTLREIALSFFFIAYEHADGRLPLHPVLSVGWTLNLEMFFYALFAAALILARRHIVPVLVLVFLALAVAGKLVPGIGQVGGFYTQGIILEFAAGLVIGKLWVEGRLGMPPLLAGLLIAGGTLYLLLEPGTGLRTIEAGVPACLIVIGALGLEPVLARKPVAWLERLGDASYALYLVHLLALGPFIRLLQAAGIEQGVVLYLGAIVLCQILGVAVHLWYEKPINRRLRALTRRRAPAVPAAASPAPAASPTASLRAEE